MTAAEKNKKLSKRGNLNSFIFFLILATLFWVLTKFSKEYEQDLNAQLELVNMPADVVVSGDINEEVPLRMKASGFEFLLFKFKKPKITVDVSTLQASPDSLWRVQKTALEGMASEQFKHQVTVNLNGSDLELPLKALSSKRIAITPAIEYNFKEGYSSMEPLSISPDSVTVVGPVNLLEQIEALRTEYKQFNDIDSDIEGEIEIALPDAFAGVKIAPEKVSYTMNVQEFIENEVTVPISLLNSDQQGIQLFPSTVKVRYTINFSEYKNVSASDFKVVCDLAKAVEGSNQLSPELVAFPEGAQNLSISPKEVEFILIQ